MTEENFNQEVESIVRLFIDRTEELHTDLTSDMENLIKKAQAFGLDRKVIGMALITSGLKMEAHMEKLDS